MAYPYVIVSLVLAAVYAVMGCVTFFAFWKDKAAAAAGRWRTREQTLHLLALMGGVLGAWAGVKVLRHKSRDVKFLLVLSFITAAHAIAWAAGLYILLSMT